jgi:hypothetical protein
VTFGVFSAILGPCVTSSVTHWWGVAAAGRSLSVGVAAETDSRAASAASSLERRAIVALNHRCINNWNRCESMG